MFKTFTHSPTAEQLASGPFFILYFRLHSLTYETSAGPALHGHQADGARAHRAAAGNGPERAGE